MPWCSALTLWTTLLSESGSPCACTPRAARPPAPAAARPPTQDSVSPLAASLAPQNASPSSTRRWRPSRRPLSQATAPPSSPRPPPDSPKSPYRDLATWPPGTGPLRTPSPGPWFLSQSTAEAGPAPAGTGIQPPPQSLAGLCWPAPAGRPCSESDVSKHHLFSGVRTGLHLLNRASGFQVNPHLPAVYSFLFPGRFSGTHEINQLLRS